MNTVFQGETDCILREVTGSNKYIKFSPSILRKLFYIKAIRNVVKWTKNLKSTFQEGVNKITRAFKSFIDLGGEIHDQMIRNKKKQKMIAIIRAIKFKT